MIHFLDEHKAFDLLQRYNVEWEFHHSLPPTGKMIHRLELYDVLWEPVKEILDS
jgi:hypothetical protein